MGQQPCLGEGQRLQCCKRLGPCSGLPQYSGAGRRQNEGLSPRAGIVHVSCVTRWGKERAGKLRRKHVHMSSYSAERCEANERPAVLYDETGTCVEHRHLIGRNRMLVCWVDLKVRVHIAKVRGQRQ